MANLFAGARVPDLSSFNEDISGWDVSNVISMISMFNSATSFNGDISKWDVSKVITMEKMFSGASSFAQTLYGAWYTSAANRDGMFDGSSGKISMLPSNSKKNTAVETPFPWC